jgi:predicted RNA-binding protein associated with RNAse of E/G family
MNGRTAWVAARDTGFRPVPAVLAGRVLYRDTDGQRRFWLLDDDVQLTYEPFGWVDEWYVEVVAIDAERNSRLARFTVTDRYVELVVRGDGGAYRLLDLDAAGAAVVAGGLSPGQLAAALATTQRFLDGYLHRTPRCPPPAVRPYLPAASAGN